jgi:hypothetical protein
MLNLIIYAAVVLAIVFGVWAILSLRESPVKAPKAAPARKQQPGLITGIGIVVAVLCFVGRQQLGLFAINPRALFEESRAGVTRSDVRDVIRDAESRVPDTIRDAESYLPQISADIEREMMKNAHGMSASDVRAIVREMEAQSRQQLRGMEGDVRREIRGMEEPVWENLRRIERGY